MPPENDPLNALRRMAEDNGLAGQKLLVGVEGPDFLRGLRVVLGRMVAAELVSVKAVEQLHPEIDKDFATSLAHTINLALLTHRYRSKLDGPSPLGVSDIQQVLAGTSVASREALSAISLALETSSKEIIKQARIAAMLPDEQQP